MFFPYKDDNPRILIPYVTYGIIALNAVVFLLQTGIGTANADLIYAFGLIPNHWTVLTLFTSMFLHGGLFHILGNMWFLWIFGDNIESAFGHTQYLVFYLLCGIGAAVAQIMIDPTSGIPMVGASGAISGVLAAYMMRYPKARVHVFVFLFFFFTTIRVPAMIVIGLWFLEQLTNGIGSIGVQSGGVAWFAHIGGFVVGVGLERIKKLVRFV
ncbi:MAG: rhomboid family intramembrane serine protease [Candidatus Marinimicrobia bacterium]|nr:rhomboid family intramembrane serine protease [Candidatus Neomarinimicrobiota bacterium]MBL7059971.1 rhomboid family intramembrane serine protease [Candidatus Neomarinimicrobiota bacterium]